MSGATFVGQFWSKQVSDKNSNKRVVSVQSIESNISPGQTSLCSVSGQLWGSVLYTIVSLQQILWFKSAYVKDLKNHFFKDSQQIFGSLHPASTVLSVRRAPQK